MSWTPVTGGVEFVFRARLRNNGPEIPGATARLVGVSTAATLIDDTLVFGPIGRNRAVWSDDTAAFVRTGRWRDLLGAFRWEVTAGEVNRAPVANAGPDQPVFPGAAVTLDGSGSSDADGDSLTYAWTLLSVPAGSTAALDDAASVAPGFVADQPGTYVAQLVVNDGLVDSAPDTVAISTVNTAPVASAGPDQTVVAGQLVTVDGGGSYDAEGDALTFAWTLSSVPPGSSAVLADPAAVSTSFLADRPGEYVLRLVVNDGQEDSAADEVVVSTTNSAPVANAGPDQPFVSLGATVTLDGSGSSDADGHPLSYDWVVLSAPAGSAAALVDAASVSPSFTPDRPGDYVVQLVVNDGYAPSAPDTVRLDVQAPLPEVEIEAVDDEAAEDGPDSGVFRVSRRAPDLRALTVHLQVSGTAVDDVDYATLGVDPSTSTLQVTIPPGQLSVDLTVTPLADDEAEPTETVVLTLLDRAEYVVVDDANEATVTIADELPVVTVVAADPNAAEAGVDGIDTGRFDLVRTGDVSLPLAVQLYFSGTATAGADYVSLGASPVTVSIPAGASAASVFVVPLVDAVVDPNETVIATLGAGPGYLVGSPDNATVVIR